MNDGRIPRGLLLEGKIAIRNALKEFELAKELDKDNEKRPAVRGSVMPRSSARAGIDSDKTSHAASAL